MKINPGSMLKSVRFKTIFVLKSYEHILAT